MLIFVQAGASCQWTADSQRLILESFDLIHDSPSHLYSSALKISPSSSWLHQYYSVGLPQDIRVVRGLSARWGSCFHTVQLDGYTLTLVCWKDTIAVGLEYGYIITLNAVTGSKLAVLSEHTDSVVSLAFFPDGISLVSGSSDKTVKLWDMKTGGVIRTFQGHTASVHSVSISPNCTTIALGSGHGIIHLWDIQTGECHHIMEQWSDVQSIHFFPLDPQHFISLSPWEVWKWDIDGHEIAPRYNASCAAFSFDGTKLVLCNGSLVQVQDSESRAVVAKFNMGNTKINHCCFSPNGRLVAVAVDCIAYVWDITNSEPCLIETFIGHTSDINSLVFSSPTSLISVCWGKSVKFWQIGTSSASPDITDLKTPSYTSPIKSITLQAKDGIAISSDSDGVVRIWDLSTGLCKSSFQTPAKHSYQRDVQLINNRLVLVWFAAQKIHIWGVEKGELLQTVYTSLDSVEDLRISGDGSKVFCMKFFYIHAWHIWTGEDMGRVYPGSAYVDSFLTTDSSRVWVHSPGGINGWDFGVPDSSSIKHYSEPTNRPHLDFIGGIRKHRSFLPGIEDTITGKVVFQPPSVSARDIYGYKISLSYNFSSSYPHSFHSIAFESRFNESETQTLIV